MSLNAGGEGGYSCAHGAQINFGDHTPCLTYAFILLLPLSLDSNPFLKGENYQGQSKWIPERCSTPSLHSRPEPAALFPESPLLEKAINDKLEITNYFIGNKK
jgi:hypothetical protein